MTFIGIFKNFENPVISKVIDCESEESMAIAF